jgi:hypothetical protein
MHSRSQWLLGISWCRLVIAPNGRVGAKRRTCRYGNKKCADGRGSDRRAAIPVFKQEIVMTTRKALLPVAATMLLALPMLGVAQNRGQNEVAGSLSYTDIADVSTTSIDVSYGRYLTPQHEVGMNVAYVDTDVDGLGSVDGTTLGAFYQFNFDSGGNMVPFIGADVAYIGGDLGDAYDFGYGVSAGAKYYPYEHVGVIIGIAWQNLTGAEDFIDDEDGFNLNVGLSLRF